MRRFWIGQVCACATVLLAVSGCCSCLETLAGDGLTATPPDAEPSNLELMDAAEQIVETEYPNALLIEAHGLPSSGSATAAEDIDQWLFIFTEDPEAAGAGTVELHYANGEFGVPVLVNQGWVGTVFERLPRVVTLADAVTALRGAGYTAEFSGVTLRKPLIFPMPEEAYYIFALPGEYIFVGMETGEVSTEL